ncbi:MULTISPECIES: hypothetical protein [unclassified Ensifer]|uniref:hypothetical protein n=1 Tax=unclassified Ensifer TaxID=2633371 RepID=UPI00081336FB|nr:MULTISPECIES: hypothetical protein [unclassified Ensifer]OCP01793.1 hypothetical protein BC362_21530 [Ensifer sp. LC14]OCP09582.1 hypothetical protein BC374_03270 [Ensifer sp. LC13]OCP10754.1 hypothetical protein BBX50_03615 [Ensifer sp. LC11]OCP32829.1 hypothetical protein BC364_03270 [Ensifer sp. LC499]
MDFTTGGVGATGLAIEIAGLAALFYDLLSGKRLNDQAASFAAMQGDLQSVARQVSLGAYRNVRTLTTLLGGVLKLLSQEQTPLTQVALATLQTKFDEASSKMVDFDQEDLKSKEEAAQLVVIANFIETIRRSQQLGWWAKLGVLLVGLGATLQLADLLVF